MATAIHICLSTCIPISSKGAQYVPAHGTQVSHRSESSCLGGVGAFPKRGGSHIRRVDEIGSGGPVFAWRMNQVFAAGMGGIDRMSKLLSHSCLCV